MTIGALAPITARDDGARVGERAQGVHVRQVGAGRRQADRLRSGREQERVPGDLARVGEGQRLVRRIDGGDARAQGERDLSARRRRPAAAAGSTPRGRSRPGSPWTGWGDRRAAPRRRRTAGSRRRTLRGAGPRRPTSPAAPAPTIAIVRKLERRRRGTRAAPRAADPDLAARDLDVVTGDRDSAPARARRRRCADRSRRGARGNGRCHPRSAPRRAVRRSGCRWRRGRTPRRRGERAAQVRRGHAQAAAPPASSRSPRRPPRGRAQRALLRVRPCGLELQGGRLVTSGERHRRPGFGLRVRTSGGSFEPGGTFIVGASVATDRSRRAAHHRAWRPCRGPRRSPALRTRLCRGRGPRMPSARLPPEASHSLRTRAGSPSAG